MTAKIVEGAGHQRKNLGECLPLATPFALHVFPAHVCNFKCSYCLHSLPHDMLAKKGFKKTVMDFSLFAKLADDATSFPKKFKVLIFAGWGEPLLHKQLAEMVDYAKRKNIAERIELVTNGVLLTNEMTRKLVDAGIDRVRISIQGLDAKKYFDIAGVEMDYGIFLRNIEYFFTQKREAKLYIKTIDAALSTDKEREIFFERFGSICDEIAIEQVIPVERNINHAKFGSTFTKRHCGGDAERVSVCPFPFYMSVIHPDGSYAPCCSPDLPMSFGNVRDNTIKSIWNGEVLRKFRIAHLEGKRGNAPLCRTCPRPQYDIQPGDNIDCHAKMLLPFYALT